MHTCICFKTLGGPSAVCYTIVLVTEPWFSYFRSSKLQDICEPQKSQLQSV